MKTPHSYPTPVRLIGVSHYHQAAGSHPAGRVIPRNQELVEVLTGGRGWVDDAGTWREVGAGDLLWHIAGDSTIQRSDFQNPYRCLALRTEIRGPAIRRVERFRKWSNLTELNAFTAKVLRLFLDEQISRDALLAYIHGRLWLEASQTEVTALPPSPAIQEVLRIIDERFRETLTVEMLAAEVGYSAAHLHDLFRKSMGTGPHDWLLQRRIRAARERLATANDPIKRIALECGFTHAAAFCHAFRSRVGESPGAFRKRQRLDWMLP